MLDLEMKFIYCEINHHERNCQTYLLPSEAFEQPSVVDDMMGNAETLTTAVTRR